VLQNRAEERIGLSSVRLAVRDARGRVMNDETPVNLYWFAIRPNKVFAVVSDQELGQEQMLTLRI
jgi:hypothetical protein